MKYKHICILGFIFILTHSLWGQSPSFDSFINRISTQYKVDIALAPELIYALDSLKNQDNYTNIEQLLQELLRSTNITYRVVDGNKILLRRESPSVSVGIPLNGTITDENGAPLRYAAVSLSATNAGTFSDEEGRFTLFTHDTTGQVVVHFLGYETHSIPVNTLLKGHT
nr:carboxypeptidase-like regulatory domain-containing protein [Bacteroidota bacterium]